MPESAQTAHELGTIRKAFCTNRTLLYGTHIQYIYSYCKCKQRAHWYNQASISIGSTCAWVCLQVCVRVCVFIRVTCLLSESAVSNKMRRE